MAIAAWTKQLEVGVPFVDQDHQKLFDLVNRLYESMMSGHGKEATGALILELQDYATSHFTREEQLLAKRGYPQLEAHQKLHREFSEQVTELKQRHEQGKALVSIDLLKFLNQWLTSHIATEDHTYAVYLAANGGLQA